MRSLTGLAEGRPHGKNLASQHCCGVTSHAFTQKISVTPPEGRGGRLGHSCAHACTQLSLSMTSAPGWEREDTWFCAPSASLIPASFPQWEHVPGRRGMLVFEETDFTYKLDLERKPTAYLMLRETAIQSNSASKTGYVGLRVEPSRGILGTILSLYDFCLPHRLKNSQSVSRTPGTQAGTSPQTRPVWVGSASQRRACTSAHTGGL